MKKRLISVLICFVMIGALLPSVSAVFEDRPDETLLYNFTFSPEQKTDIEGWFTPNESVKIEWVSKEGVGHGDDDAIRVQNIDSNYQSVRNVLRLTLPEPLPLGYEYRIIAWVYASKDDNPGKGNLMGPNICINNNYEAALGVSKFPEVFGRLPYDEWRLMDAEIPVQTADIEVIDFRLYTNNASEHPDVWYWDNIEIWQGARDENIRVPTWNLALPSLAEAYKDYFLIGNIMTPGNIWFSTHSEMFLHQFNAVTAENAMKPVYVALESGHYDFHGADRVVDWGEENNIPVHGHTLIWHQQSAAWLTEDANGNPLTREEARNNMEAYINAYAGRYGGRIASWDVVNEAFDNSVTSGGNWKGGLRRSAPWYKAYDNYTGDDGHPSDYIYDAFVFTRLATPDSVLFYNDFNEEEPGKRDAIANMADEFNARWKDDPRNTEPDRFLIEGIGMQSHHWVDTIDTSLVREAIQRFARSGLRIRITELDIPFGSWGSQLRADSPPLTESQLNQQANHYKALFQIFINNHEHIDAVTIWGLTDPMNWRGNGLPVLFDEFFDEKPAFWAILDVVDPGAYERFYGLEAPPPDDQPLIQPTPPAPETPPPSQPDLTEPAQDDNGFPWWGIVLIIAGVAILVALLLVSIKKSKKND